MVTRAQRPGTASAVTSRPSPPPPPCTTSGFNHFFQRQGEGDGGDQIFFQGHAAPGIYARAYLLGRLNEGSSTTFRQETGGNGCPNGLRPRPPPRLMPDFWEFPTVSMGLGPLGAIYQARMNRLHDQALGIADASASHVWAFLGDGEMDEVESLRPARHGGP
ncbi:pyruvate dehydrogenase (acetyl-transferring), homodimeric type [Streptomyces tanashiensis]